MKKIFQITLLTMGLSLGTLLTACSSANASETTTTATATPEEVSVDNKNTINVFGSVQGNTTQEVYLDFTATVENVCVKEGDRLKKGDPILTLNYESFKNDIAKKEQEIAGLQIKLAAAENGIEPATAEASNYRSELSRKESTYNSSSDPEITPLEESITLAKQTLTIKKNEYKAQKELLAAGACSEKEVEAAEQAVKAAEATLNSSQATLAKTKQTKEEEINTLKASLSKVNSQISSSQQERQSNADVLRTQIATANIELKDMKQKLNNAMLKDYSLVATNNCIVSSISAKSGTQLGGTTATSLATLVSEDSLVITVDIPESFISKVHIGSEADVTLYADSEHPLKGKISRISNTATVVNGETMIKADVTVDQGKEALRVGYQADVTIH